VTLYRPPFARDALVAAETDRQAVLEAKRAEKAKVFVPSWISLVVLADLRRGEPALEKVG
jgi:hypothetical protein